VWIEALWPKRRILEVYLNVAQLGPCTFGVEAASWRFFNRPATDLTAAEGALLAAVLPNPVRLKAGRPSEYVLGRVDWILEQEARLGGARFLGGL
jgi:monofunctional biosynthetic peptidoglycan transglycosylase